MPQQFDPNLEIAGFPLIKGSITSVTVNENVALPHVSNHVIDPTTDLRIDVAWEVDEFLTNLWLQALKSQGSEWRVSCYAESQGDGDEQTLGQVTVPVGPLGPLPYTNSAQIHVPPNVPLDEHNPATGHSGVYKLVVAIFLNNDHTTVPGDFDMIGFSEGPYIQVEDPE